MTNFSGEQTGKTETSIRSEEQFNAKAISNPWILSRDQWSQLLTEYFHDFEGNKENAAEILFQMSRGMKIVIDAFTAKGLVVEPPRFGFLINHIPGTSAIYYDADNNCAMMSVKFLADLSRLRLSNLYAFTRGDGDESVIFKGKVSSLARNLGIEESHHAVYIQKKGKNLPLPIAFSDTTAQYDSADHEYKALKWQHRISKMESDPPMTVEHLAQRITDAQAIRIKSRDTQT